MKKKQSYYEARHLNSKTTIKRPTQAQVKEAVNILVADFLRGSTKKAVAKLVKPGANLIVRSIVGVFEPVVPGTPGFWLQKAVLFGVQEREYPAYKARGFDRRSKARVIVEHYLEKHAPGWRSKVAKAKKAAA